MIKSDLQIINSELYDPLDDIDDITNNSIVNDAVNTPIPFIKILEQPASKSLRFRYECEGKSAGSLIGALSSSEHKTFPSIQIIGFTGKAVVVVSCVTKDRPYKPHPHNLVGKEGCKKGVCTMLIPQDSMIIEFRNLGIQCVKRKNIDSSLNTRKEIRVDPFQTGFDHKNHQSSINLSVVRLCFQVFLADSSGKPRIPLKPVVSDPIYDKKMMSDLVIKSLCSCSSSVNGGTRIILLCDKVNKDDILVRFFEENGITGDLIWEAFGDFQPNDVHFQTAIELRTPQYQDLTIESAVKINVQLLRPSDNLKSEPIPFILTPLDSTRSKLWNLFRQYEQQENSNKLIVSKTETSMQESTETNDNLGDNMSYSSIQLAYKNTVLDDQYDEVYIETNLNSTNCLVWKNNLDLDQIPPLPPKRYRRMSEINSHGRQNIGSCYSIALTELQAEKILKPKPILRSISLRSSRPPQKNIQKKPNFLKRIFSKKKIDSYDKSLINEIEKPVNSSMKYYSSNDLIIHIPLKDNENNSNGNSIGINKDNSDLDLTEAENYALYTAIAPHATQSEFDEMSYLYSSVNK